MDLIGEIQIRPLWNPNRCCHPGTTPAVRHRTMLQETSRTFQSLVHQPAAQQEVDKVGDGTACQSHCVAHTLVTIGRAIQHHPRYKQRHTPCSVEDGGTKGQDGHIIAARHLPHCWVATDAPVHGTYMSIIGQGNLLLPKVSVFKVCGCISSRQVGEKFSVSREKAEWSLLAPFSIF